MLHSDRYFRENHNIIVSSDKDAISSVRPSAYIEHEQMEIRRQSSVTGADVNQAAAMYRMSQLEKARSRSIGGGSVQQHTEFVEKV